MFNKSVSDSDAQPDFKTIALEVEYRIFKAEWDLHGSLTKCTSQQMLEVGGDEWPKYLLFP